jgi:hypothetical protein
MAGGSEKLPLCFILAPAYHGAGMLAWRMSHHPDVFSLGTGNPIRGEDQVCSCGERVSTCPCWTNITAGLDLAEDDPLKSYLPQSPYLFKNQKLNIMVNGAIALMANEVSPKAWKMVYEQAERFYAMHDKFLTLCRSWVQHKVFVDAERSNIKFMSMSSMGFPVKGVIHLTRDPRGYAAQWKKFYPESTVEKPTLEWVAAHTRIRRLKNLFPRVSFTVVKYEDLLEKPDETLLKVLNFVNVPRAWPEDLRLDARKNHLIGLGPQDTEGGMAPRAENWRETLHPEDQERVIKAAGPLFSELGYKP